MKILLLFSLISLNSLAQNYYVPHTLNIPKLPAPDYQIEWADVYMDGFADMVTANEYTHELMVYPNNGGVVDSVPISYPAGIQEFWITDWNNDGRPDVFYSAMNGSSLELLLNNPSGGFYSPVTFSTLPTGTLNKFVLTVRDLNADNFPDMVFDAQDSLYLLYNNAGSTTLTSQSISLPPFTRSACLTDVNADGNLDLVMLPGNGGHYLKAVIYQNTGAYNFIAVDTVAFANGITELSFLYCLDLNNDGTDEILALSEASLTVAQMLLYVAQKSTGFQYNQIHVSNYYFQQITTGGSDSRGITDFADIDGNGYKDIVIANSVYFNTNAALTRIDILAQPDYNYPYVKVTDTDNNGVKELWWNMHEYSPYGESFVYSITHNSGTTLYPRVRQWDVNAYVDAPVNKNFIDFDNDGDRDFLYQSAGRIMVAVNDGIDNFTDVTVIAPTGLQNGALDVVDVDDDGLPDVLQTNGSTISGFSIQYYHNNGSLQFVSMGNIFTLSSGTPHLIAFEDFDNDNIRDFAISYYVSAFPTRIEIFNNNLTTFPSQGIVYTGGGSTGNCEIADLDHNGYKDMIVDVGGVVALLNNGAFSFTAAFGISFPSFLDQKVGVADINSDGFEDYLIARYDNFFQTSRIKARINNGNGTFGSEIFVSAPFNLIYGFFTTDVNNDGLKDIVCQDGFQIAINNGSGINPWIANGTVENPNSLPVQLDVDSDGDMDLVNTFNHTWFDNTSISANSINGTVFYDVNTNGTKDAGDIAIENFPVATSPLVAITNTDASGQFSMRMGGSTGTFAVVSKNRYNSNFTFTTNPYPDSATISTANPIDNVSIGFFASAGIHQALLDQSISSHRCNNQARLWMNPTNFSPLASAMIVQLTLPANVSFINSSITPSSQTGNLITWNLSATSFEEKNFWLNVIMPNFTFSGDTLNFISTLASTQASGTVTVNDTLPVVLTCAFDPNDKLTVPLATQLSGDKLYVFDDYVEYQVRFQNTGTDTAQTVVIKDLLNSNFDLSTIEIISASNNFIFSMDNNRLLTVTFNNIQLPDSGTNFTGSMGYVKFAIRLLPNTPHNIAIRNNARIYFDQNDPVYTNKVDIYRVACPEFINPVYSSFGFCAGTSYTATINNHDLNAQYTWSLDGNVFATNDSSAFTITHTGNNLINIHIDLGVCQYDSLQTFYVALTATPLTISAPADTSVCPNLYVYLFSNIPASWYINDSLISTGINNFTAYGGDTVVATYSQGSCVSRAQTILHDMFPMHETLLNEPTIPYGQTIYRCEGITLNLNSYNNAAWEWWLDNYPVALTDTATFINIYLDPLGTFGNFNLKFDTMGCHYEEYYDIYIGHAGSQPLIIDTSFTIMCNGNPPQFAVNEYLDSLQLYIGGVYDTTMFGVNQSQPYLLIDTGYYSAIGYNFGCVHPTAYFTVASSIAPFPTVGVVNNVLFSSDGSIVTWYYSFDSLNFSFIAFDDTLYSQPEGYYYFTGINADGCLGDSPIYHFLFTSIDELQNETIWIHYNALLNELMISGLSSLSHPQLTVYNQQGQTVYTSQAVSKNHLPKMAAGVYMVMIKTDKGVFTNRIVVVGKE